MKSLSTLSFLVFFYFAFFSLKAQSSKTDSLPPLEFTPKLEIGIVQGIGLGFEIPISQKSVFEISAGLGSGYTIYNINGTEFSNTWVINNPAFYAQAKYKAYYNRQKRLDKGKSILNNSGNYVGVRFKYASRQLSPTFVFDGAGFFAEDAHNVTLLDVHWGIQRPMGQRFLFNLNLGIGYGLDWDTEAGSIYPAADVRFAYKLWK